MSEFDPIDDRLGDALRRRTGVAPTSTAAAHDAVVRRAGTIRRRRAAIAGGGAMAVLLIGGIALVPRGSDEIGPLDTGDVLPTFEQVTTTAPELDDSSESGAAPNTVDLTIPDVTAPDVTDPTDAGTTPATSIEVSVSSVGAARSPSTAAPTATAPSTTAVAPSTTAVAPSTTATAPSTTATAPSTTATAPSTTEPEATLAPFTKSYQSEGGSITVSWDGTTLTLQAISPTTGFVAEVEDSSTTRVRVRFDGGDDDSRIEVRVDDGVERVDIS